MRIAGGWFVLVLLVVGSSAPVFAMDYKIMPLGDSITAGTTPGGYRLPEYNLLVGAGNSVNFTGSQTGNPSSSLPDSDHEGHGGWLINDIAGMINSWLDTYQPAYIQMMIGTNDNWWGTPLGASDRLDSLVNQITTHTPSARLMVASITPITGQGQTVTDNVNAYNAAVPGIVSKYAGLGRNVRYVDMFSALTAGDLQDGIHPNQAGYDKMGQVWANAVTTPEPATLGLLAFGAAALLRRRTRRPLVGR